MAETAIRAVVLLQGDDFGDDTVWFWWWLDRPEEGATVRRVGGEMLRPALAALDLALPSPISGRESVRAALERAFDGAMSTRATERELSRRLGEALLGQKLMEQIRERISDGVEIELRITPPPSCVRVPWVLLIGPDAEEVRQRGEGERLGELVTVVDEVPASFHVGRARVADYDGGPVAAVIDPDLGEAGMRLFTDAQRARLRRTEGVVAGEHVDAGALSDMLTGGPSLGGLALVGHVIQGASAGANTSFALSPAKDQLFDIPAGAAEGRLSAADLVLGVRGSEGKLGSELWPMPPKVAIIACSSGADLGRREPFGIVIATMNSGARWALATRWVLPVDRSFRAANELADQDPQPFWDISDLVLRTLAVSDSTRAVANHLKTCLRRWDETPDDLDTPQRVALSPLTWGALAVFRAERRLPTSLADAGE